MRVAGVVLAIVLGCAFVVGGVWYAQRPTVGTTEEKKVRPAPNPAGPPISPTGPWPKIVLAERAVMFEVMEVGEKRTKTFKVKNEGQAPLLLKKGPTNCQCTLSTVAEAPIPPGKSADVEVSWLPEAATDSFMKSATIYTNDPEMPQFDLQITGRVKEQMLVTPSGSVWEIPEPSDTQPVTFLGAIYSLTIPEFKATVESSSEGMKVELLPMSPTQKYDLRASSGYQVSVTVVPNKTSGNFRYPFTIKTDQKKRLEKGGFGGPLEFKIVVQGGRKGAFRFFGPAYGSDDSSVNLGSFEAREGKTVELRTIVSRGPQGGTKIESATCDPPEIKAELVPVGTPKPGKPETFTLRITYPEGSPPLTRGTSKPGELVITTNHPEVQQVKLKVYLNAY